jgi:Rieske Fe-S protein
MASKIPGFEHPTCGTRMNTVHAQRPNGLGDSNMVNSAGTTRRAVVAAAGAAGMTAALAACGSDTSESADTKPAGDQPPAGSNDGGGGGGGAGELGSAADIPVGGGKVFKDQKIVVTQPAKGDFKAFSAVCTHQGCIVGEVSGGTINCPCHGSKFKVEDGSVAGGPAPKPLEAKQVSVEGGSIKLA